MPPNSPKPPKDQYGIELQCDRAGAEWLDSFIHSRNSTLNPSTQAGLIKLLGSFLGECITREYGGQWIVDNGRDRVRIGADGWSTLFGWSKVA